MATRSLMVLLPVLALLALLLWPSGAHLGGNAGLARDGVQPTRRPAARDADLANGLVEGAAITASSGLSRDRVAPARSFFGLVLDHERRPFGGARVSVRAARGIGAQRELLASAISDATGRFEILAEDAWPELCLVSASTGAATSVGHSVAAGRAVELVLSLPAALAPVVVAGLVTDAETRWPLADVRVSAGQDETLTDGRGRFEFAATARGGWVTLSARCEGYAGEQVSFEVGAQPMPDAAIELVRLQDIRVRVLDAETEAPIEGAVLVERSHRGVGRTDAAGECAFEMPRSGLQGITVRAPGYCAVVWKWRAEQVRSGRAQIPLPRGVLVTGAVVDESDRPVSTASVWIDPGDDFIDSEATAARLARAGTPGTLRLESGSQGVRTDARGRFEIRTLCRDGPAIVRAELDAVDGILPAVSAALDLARGGIVVCGPLVLVRGGSIAGKVSRNGEPCPGRVVWYRADGRFGGEAEVSEDGSYALERVAPGARAVAVFASGTDEPSARATAVVAAGHRSALDIAFGQATASISGRVAGLEGDPLRGVTVFARSQDEGASRSAHATTDGQGRFVLTVRDAGRYDVAARHDAVRRVHHGVAPGSTDIDFAALAFGRLRLRLFDRATRAPVGGAGGSAVRLRWWKDSEGADFHRADLEFVAPGLAESELPLGTLAIEVLAQRVGYQPMRVEGVVVSRDAHAPPRDVPLLRGVDVRFVVDDPAGLQRAMEGRRLFVLEQSQLGDVRGPLPVGEGNLRVDRVDYWVRSPSIWSGQQLSVDGSARVGLRGLAPGHYSLVVLPAGIAFQPPEFVLDEMTREVRLTWRRP